LEPRREPAGNLRREKLPAGTNSGVIVDGDTLIAPAGVAAAAGQNPQIVAFRLGE